MRRSDLRRIYRAESIKVDLWPYRFKGVRGAYLNDELGATVMVVKGLPVEPFIFTLAHELKHHLVDQTVKTALCAEKNQNDAIEIGAEIFAAELIFPEKDFCIALEVLGVGKGQCEAETLVKLKHETQTTLSYAALVKRAEYLKFVPKGSFARMKWTKLALKLYGEPIYKRIRPHKQHLG
ncbi:MAG TPA: ImmA/IrrE family metallo-endopeptidase [Candidatus Bathyarchaeia archaeon]